MPTETAWITIDPQRMGLDRVFGGLRIHAHQGQIATCMVNQAQGSKRRFSKAGGTVYAFAAAMARFWELSKRDVVYACFFISVIPFRYERLVRSRMAFITDAPARRVIGLRGLTELIAQMNIIKR